MAGYDVGDTATTALTVVGPNGAPADGGTVTCTLTNPDQTTTALTVVHAGTGSYTASQSLTQPGLYQVAWLVTGTNAMAFNDMWWTTASGNLLVSVNDTMEFLNLLSAPVPANYTERLRSFIQSVTAIIEGIVGPVFPAALDEYYDGGAPTILLNESPVMSVTSVVEAGGGGFVRTLTNQPPDTVGSLDAYGYTVDLSTGTLVRRVSGLAAPFLPGKRNVHVVYVAGNLDPSPNLREAALELIRINWQPQQGGNRPGYATTDVDTLTINDAWRMGYFIPNRVMEMLAPSRHTWGIA